MKTLEEKIMDLKKHDRPLFMGPTMPVPNVLEMVRKGPLHAPRRYIRTEQDMALDRADKAVDRFSSDIPVIDLSLRLCRDEHVLKEFDLACKDWGFFQVFLRET